MPAAHPITPQAIERCLRQSGIRTSGNVDRIAQEAGVGALAAIFARNRVDIVVERTDHDASSTVRAYEGLSAGLKMRLEQTGPVVAAYTKTPTLREKRAVSQCVQPRAEGP
jgi:hypothetical protein